MATITDTQKVKETVLKIVRTVFAEAASNITRVGKEDLMSFLVGSDFITAPASAKFHSHFSGGLITHSWQVYLNALALCQKYIGALGVDKFPTDEGVFISTMFHDLCKVHFYVQDWKWAKNDAKQWYKQPIWKIADAIPMGHGERSLFMLQNFIKVSVKEALAIRYHLQFIDPGAHNNWTSGLSSAWDQYPYAVIVGLADSETAISETHTAFLYEGDWYEVPEEMQFPWPELVNLRNELRTKYGKNGGT